MILERKISLLSIFISKEIFFSLIGVLLILSILILGNQLFIVSKESIKIGLESSEIFPYVLFKYLGDLTDILIISYILSSIMVFLKLKKRSEKIIIHTGGLSSLSIIKNTLPIFLPFFLLVNVTSSYFSPWASKQENIFKELAKNRPSYLSLKENQFQKIGKYTFYSPSIVPTDDGQEITDVFLVSENTQKPLTIITAKNAYKTIDQKNRNVFMNLNDGYLFENVTTESIGKITKFSKYLVKIYEDSFDKIKTINDPQSFSLNDLIIQNNNLSMGEIHYRFTKILTVIYVIFFFTVIAGLNPRSNKNFSPLITLIFYLFCVNFGIFSQSLIEKQVLSFIEGFLSTNLIFIGIIYIVFVFKKKYLIN